MKFKLKDKEVDTNWHETFVFYRKTQDNWRVFFENVWVKFDLTSGRKIYRVEK